MPEDTAPLYSDKQKERGVMLRVFVYVVAAHALAAFLYLLFYVGAHAK